MGPGELRWNPGTAIPSANRDPKRASPVQKAVEERERYLGASDPRLSPAHHSCALVPLTIRLATGRVPTSPNRLDRIHLGTASSARRRAALRKAGTKR